jgi:N-hydroxyarylamine O-acetyltransferase
MWQDRKLKEMDIGAYLRRIDYHGKLDTTIDTLRALHRAHIHCVPFENLDIALGRWITLDEDLLFDKIVNRKRGGFCFEVNGLFSALLRELGFKVKRLSARMGDGNGSYGMELGHMTLMVELEERWLADVCGSFIEPLRIDERGVQVQERGRYRIEKEGKYLRYQMQDGDVWVTKYLFRLQPYALTDYIEPCTYTQTSPESWFTQRRICTRATPDGRISLNDMTLFITNNGTREERQLQDEIEFHSTLLEYFGIVL